MALKVIMPKQGLQMTEGTIIKWLVKEGERTVSGQPLFEMETDKLSIEMESPESGTLLKIVRAEGETVPITETIAVIGEPGEDISEILAETFKNTEVAPTDTGVLNNNEKHTVEDNASLKIQGTSGERVFITPRAKMAAKKKGIDISEVEGTGPEKLIIERDINAHVENMQVMPGSTPKNKIPAGEKKGRIIPFTGMRKAISEKMMQSLHCMAQANHRIRVDMSEVIRLRENLKEDGIKVSFTGIIVKVVAKALLDHPILNSSLTDDGILVKDHVNMGIAVAVENGLIVPVIKDADLMSLQEISKTAAELVEKAKQGVLKPDEYTGGTFTVTNLGMYDIDEFTAVINPPESAILAVGKIDRIPVAEGDNIVIKPMMMLSLTYDHRIIDGAPAARFLQSIRQIMQNPC